MDASGVSAGSTAPVLDDDELQSIYVWVDSIPLSRPKRNIARDFSDGVLMAEIVAHYFPKLIELHNYSAANSVRQKLYNWATLNQKALKRIGYEIPKTEIEGIVNCRPGVIEYVLHQVQTKIAEYRSRKTAGGMGSSGSSDGSPMAAAAAAAAPAASGDAAGSSVLLAEKDATIAELRETVDILELKIKKLEQLVRLKDSRIATLDARLRSATGVGGTAPPGGIAVIPAGV